MPINNLIQAAKNVRAENKPEYERKKRIIAQWFNGVKNIRETFMQDNSGLWAEEIEGHNMHSMWTQICELIGDENTEGGLYSNLLQLGDGDKPGLFSTAYHRICRDKINLGVVGAFRQGKSTLLQQYIIPTNNTIAPQQIIPHNDGRIPCTGTSINYIFSDNNKPAAVIHYFSVREMCEMINKYIDELKLNGWEKINLEGNVTINDIRNYCENHTSAASNINDAQANSLQATFKNIILYYAQYLNLLGHDDENITDLTLVDNRRLFYKRTTFNFDTIRDNYAVYAVKSADVFVRFEIDGELVEDIQFLDTPGIGENRVGVDETLRDKLLNDIDTVIAVEKAVADAVPDEALRRFHTSLKMNFGHAKNFAYYVIANTVGCNCNHVGEAYRAAFRNGIETSPSPLILPDTHKLIVDNAQNEVYSYTVTKDGGVDDLEVDANRNCQTVLHDILENLAINIGEFDAVCTRNAEELYSIVRGQIQQLAGWMQTIVDNNNNGNDYAAIANTVNSLHRATMETQFSGITDVVVSTIKEYASQDTVGKEILYALKPSLKEDIVNTIMQAIRDLPNDKKADTFAEETIKAVGKYIPCTVDMYESWHEFDSYCDLKRTIHKNICDKLEKLIDPEPIQECINNANGSLFAVFRQPEFLGFLCKADASNIEWYTNLMGSISDPIWKKCFSDLFLYDVHNMVKDFIEREIVRNIIRNYMHKDTFNGKAFDGDVNRANKSFIKSLWEIENGIKTSLRDGDGPLTEKLRNDLDRSYQDIRSKALKFEIGNPLFNSFVNFIGAHYHDILEYSGNADDVAKRKALCDQWKVITQNIL